MKTLILASICFDFTGGEYSCNYVEDILLGVCQLEDEKEIQVYGQTLLEEYCKNEYGARIYDSSFILREI